jgi:hypothetical protein
MRRVLPAICACLLLSVTELHASDFSGNFSTFYYGLEGRNVSGSVNRDNLFFQYASLRAADLGVDGLSLASSFRFRGDASDDAEDEGHTRIYSLYLDAGLDLRLGRQFLYSGVGTGLLDGAKARLQPVSWLAFSAWAGTQVRYLAEPEVASWNEAAMWGGRILLSDKSGTRVGAGFLRRMRGGELERKLLGFDLATPEIPWADVYARLDVDLELDRLHNATVRVNPRYGGPFAIDLEYSRRLPSIPANSFFNFIDFKGYDEVRILPVYRLKNGVSVDGEYAYVHYHDGNTHRIRGGLSWEQLKAGLLYRTGYAGGRLGMYASVTGDLPMGMEGLFQLDYAKFNLVDGESLDSESLVAVFRITRDLAQSSSFAIELQEGRNPAFDSDFRVLARYNYRFRIKR